MGHVDDQFARLAALKPTRAMPLRRADLRLSDETDPISVLLGGGIARNRYGEHLAIRKWFSTPESTQPSPTTLDLLTKTPASANGCNKSRSRGGSAVRRMRTALEDPEKWLFLDTETTGLAGGTGTYAFLVGLAWWDAGGLQVEQLFLRDLHEEYSLLQELSERLAERPVLVSFNGKSFDWPLLENRFTMTRNLRTPKLVAHFDLLHPARALWKLRLGSVRLVELERHVLDAARLGWRRDDDVASALIPQYYFDYLRGGTMQPLAGVVEHNQMDLRGLAALFAKINSLLESRENAFVKTDPLDLFGLSKFLHRKGDEEGAHSVCSYALDAGLPAEFRPQATRELALMTKRRGERDHAAALWHELVANPDEAVFACEQLAIHYERHARDFARALEFVQLGLKELQRQFGRSRNPYTSVRQRRTEETFVCRLKRLRHRIKCAEAVRAAPLLVQAASAAGSKQGAR
jgi:uncharacterized protein YprB with RNaseH-like and TPR domain